MLFRKEPSAFEVYNDANSDLVNLFRAVREQPEQLIRRLEFVLNAKQDFDETAKALKEPLELGATDTRRAAQYYQLIKQSYGGKTSSFGCQPTNMWATFPMIRQTAHRLQNVIIEHRDFEKLIGIYDRPESFFYLDPPYYGTEDYYRGVGFTKQDHERLANCLACLQGKFLLSYNAAQEIIGLYQRLPNVYMERISRPNNLAARYGEGMRYDELFISNYDTARELSQMSLWDNAAQISTKAVQEREYIWKPRR